MVLGAAYMLWVFNRVFYGNLRTSTLFLARDVDTRESFYLAFLVLGLLWLGIDPTFITDTVHLFSLFVTL
jgi:NADH-quinone oxidoreductase subunit M